jgi:hypothetical protein
VTQDEIIEMDNDHEKGDKCQYERYSPQRSESSGKPSAWVGLANDELTDLFHNTSLGQASAVAQAIELLKEKNT